MTPRPMHIKIELDEKILAAVIGELRLSDPPKFQLNHNGIAHDTCLGKNAQVRGTYSPAKNLVTIASSRPEHQSEGLSVLTRHIGHTVLHELRHAFQRENWTAEDWAKDAEFDYHAKPSEIDANEWAQYARPKYAGLVKVTRRFVGGQSGFQRLGSSVHPSR